MTEPPASTPRRAWSRHWLAPLVLSLLVLAWQSGFVTASHESRHRYAMAASMGLCPDVFRFFYFFHHFGVYPVGALDVPKLGPTHADAERYVREQGERLQMDFGWPVNTPRFGDHGKLFLFFPDLWLRGDPAHPSAMPFNQILFMTALVALLWSFWREGRLGMGVALVLLAGSNPFQVVETYARGNIFSLPISVTLLMLAAHLRLLTRRKSVDAWAFAVAVASALLLASFREVRSEASVAVVSVLASYLLARGRFAMRALLAFTFVATLALTGQAWASYWRAQFVRAEAFVKQAGGEVFRAPGGLHHALWHAVACGLGDHGADRGFSWDDREAFRWATTYDAKANPRPLPYTYTSGYYFDETYDGVHHVAPTDVPEYNALMRERVLRQIRAEPLWYARILLSRFVAVQRDATPAALAVGPWTLTLPGAGWLTLPVLLLACWRRNAFAAMLVLFLVPLSAPALLIYSAKGMTHYGIAHLAALVVGVAMLREMSVPPSRQEAPHVA